MTSITSIAIDRLSSALARHGVRMKRMKLLQSVAEALGYRNVHEFEAAASKDGLRPPEARYMGRTRVANVGWMHFFQDPDGTVFAVDQDRFDGLEGREADWILSPMGGVLDVSAIRGREVADGKGTAAPMPSMTNLCVEVDVPGDGAPMHVQWGPTDPEHLFHPRFAPNPVDPEVPAYMTNGCCEVATVTQADLEALGLPFGEFDGGFYPLTPEEELYVAEDVVDGLDGLHSAMTGYSVLFRGAKHLMPSIEIEHARYEGHVPSRDEVLGAATAYADRIRAKAATMGGDVLVATDMPDRIVVQIPIPLDAAMALGSPQAWQDRLAWILVDPDLPQVPRQPVRHTGREYAAEVLWLGEGEDGDYDPIDPADRPLLRYDAYRLVDGEWTEERDGSYCTQVPAWCTHEQAKALAKLIADRLDAEGGPHNKRLLESMSWIDLDKVKAAMRDIDAASAADDFIAHVTYGNPDQGTSVDLRRRADGSVRCEVYVDLDCAALLEADDGMPEVRAWLATLPCDIENADGAPLPSHALAPQWDGIHSDSVRWMLVHAGEDEASWFADTSHEAPFPRRFIPLQEMDV